MIKRLLILASILASSLFVNAGAGDWKIYRAYNDITEIWPGGDNIYVLSSNSLFTYRVSDGSIEAISKLSGLNENTIKHIAWCQPAHKLVITYENSNIDILSENGEVDNILDLYNKSMTADKTINSIMINGKFAYLSCGFGIVKVNVANAVINDTYSLDFNIEWSYIEDGYFYASSKKDGLYRCSLSSNLLDKSNWKRVGGYKKPTNDLTNVYDSHNNCYWTKDEKNTLTAYKLSADGEKTYTVTGIKPDGPAYNEFFSMLLHDKKVYSVRGLFNVIGDKVRMGNISTYDIANSTWSYSDESLASELKYRNIDYNCIDIDPLDNNHIMVGARSGLYEYKDGKLVNIYTNENKGEYLLTSVNGDPTYTVINGIKFDKNGNLWVLNRKNENIIKISHNGEWENFSQPFLKEQLAHMKDVGYIHLDSRGLLWFVNTFDLPCVMCYNPATNKLYGFPDIINQDNTSYTLNFIRCITEDKNHNVWFGTSAGPFYFTKEDIERMIQSDNSNGILCQQHKVPRNDGSGYADYLLSNVDITYIFVDDANRKWFSTNGNGIYVISDDCNTEEYHFTTSNSYLTDDNVNSIVMNGKTGEVYFGTDYGLCSFMSDVTDTPEEMDTETIYAYPNPVEPDYTGYITIVGLTRDAHVIITTSNGVKVAEGNSKGGSFQWDGRDTSGNRVASGIYNVITSTADGDKGSVCKIAIVR